MTQGPDPSKLRGSLAESPPFSMLTREVIDDVFAHMQLREFAPGETLIQQGAPADSLMVMVSGSADVRVTDHQGVSRTIASLGRSDVVGEMALLTREPRSADVIATTEVQLLRLDAEDFDRLADKHPELTVVLTEILAERLGRQRQDMLGGKSVEGYRILRCLGRGGMAMVYEAEHELEGGERVALKMMNHRLLFHAGATARFQREADILMALDHENVTRVKRCFAAFRTSFLVMELCDGPVLSDYLRDVGPLPEETVRAFLGQLACALRYLHGREVMHRDLKPGNVLLTSSGTIKLTDFGLARQWTPSTMSTTLTTEGTVIGTPLYMAPEQILGGEIGPEADIYAFGCIGLELVMGKLPFVSKDLPSLIDEKQRFRVPTAEATGPGISPELHAVLSSCMSHDAAARHLDMDRVAGWAAPFGLS